MPATLQLFLIPRFSICFRADAASAEKNDARFFFLSNDSPIEKKVRAWLVRSAIMRLGHLMLHAQRAQNATNQLYKV